MFKPSDVVVLDFPGVRGIKRRPAVIVSSSVYHASRPDVVVGLITSRTTRLGAMDYVLRDWSQAGLKLPSVFRCFFATLPGARVMVVGELSRRDWRGVRGRVRIALAPLATQKH